MTKQIIAIAIPDRQAPKAVLACVKRILPGTLGESARLVEDADDTRPYWLWRALLEDAAKTECSRNPEEPCAQTSDCITEWCCNCAARACLAEAEQ